MPTVRLFRIIASRAPLVLATAAVVTSIALLASLHAPTAFDAHALARFAPPPSDAASAGRVPGAVERAQALVSDRVLRAVAHELRLARYQRRMARKLGLSSVAVALVMEFGRGMEPVAAVKALPLRLAGGLAGGLDSPHT